MQILGFISIRLIYLNPLKMSLECVFAQGSKNSLGNIYLFLVFKCFFFSMSILSLCFSTIQMLNQLLEMEMEMLSRRQKLFLLKMETCLRLRIKMLCQKAQVQLVCMINGLHLWYLVHVQNLDMRYSPCFSYYVIDESLFSYLPPPSYS